MLCLKFKIMFHQTTLILGGFPLLDHQIRQRHHSCGTRDLGEVKGQSNYAGCLIGILIMVYHNPYIAGQYNLLYNLHRWFFFIAQSSLDPSETNSLFCYSREAFEGFFFRNMW